MIYGRKEINKLEKGILSLTIKEARALAIAYRLQTIEEHSYCSHFPNSFTIYLEVARLLGLPHGKIELRFNYYNKCPLQENNGNENTAIKYPWFADPENVTKQLKFIKSMILENEH
jgi:hypothetical protein